MADALAYADEEEWVIWNSEHGLVTTVTVGHVETRANGRVAWMDEPFDMVGPFDLDELETQGRIRFEAALIMSREVWQQEQVALRRESLNYRRAEAERINREYAHYSSGRSEQQAPRKPFNEQKHRKILKLPMDGKLDAGQIKAAFRKLAQKAHPDVGGNHELFVEITAARDALLEFVS